MSKSRAGGDDAFNASLANIKDERKLKFIELLPVHRYYNITAQAVGISDRTVSRWLVADKDFMACVSVIKKAVNEKLVELHENNIDSIAFDDKAPKQTRVFASLVKLRALAPERYREDYSGRVEHEVVHSVRFILPDGSECKAGELKGRFKELPAGDKEVVKG